MNNRTSEIIAGIITAILIVWGSSEISKQVYFDGKDEEVLARREKLNEIKFKNDENELLRTNAAQLENALAEAEKSYSSLKPLVPPEAELPQILNWVALQARQRNLKLEHFSQGTQVKQQGSMSEIPIQVEVYGYYDGVGRFIEDFSRFERLLRVRSVNMIQDKQQDSVYTTVRANISFSAYVSRENQEITGK